MSRMREGEATGKAKTLALVLTTLQLLLVLNLSFAGSA